jgi:uncharacterized protein (TIGR02284 family)
MREDINDQIDALNDLIRTNNDRITGYRQRIATTPDDDMAELLANLIYQSYQHIEELTYNIYELGGNPARANSAPGKFYHSWTDFKTFLYKETRKKMLEYCEFCEDVVKAIYQKAFNAQEIHWDKKVSALLKKHLHDVENSYHHVLMLKGGFA